MSIEDDPEGNGLDYPPRTVRGNRWTLLSDDVAQRIQNSLRAGATVQDACAYGGIARDTYYEWMRRGEEYHERLSATPPNEFEPDEWEERYRAFWEICRGAHSEARVRANLTMVDLMQHGRDAVRFRAAAFVLERSDPAHWGRQVALTGPGAGPLEVRDVTVRDQEMAAKIRRRRLDAIDVESRDVAPIPEYDPWAPFVGPDDVPEIIWPDDIGGLTGM